MEKANIIKAWKDPEYRASLTQEELKSLPEHPAGILDSEDLKKIKGGFHIPEQRTIRYNCGWVPTISGDCWGGINCNPFKEI